MTRRKGMMADIFLSYAREDAERASEFVDAFEAEGWSVFWDPKISAGETWHDRLLKELSAAKTVVVLWSRSSVVVRPGSTGGAQVWIDESYDEGNHTRKTDDASVLQREGSGSSSCARAS
jgi:hypothetical protein